MRELPLKGIASPAGSEWATLVELLRWRASHQSDQRAYTFLTKGEEELSLTYAELDRQARAIGAMLQRQGASGERVLLLYPAGLEYIAAFFGCLYAGVLAVPAYPPRSNRSLRRIESIVADAQAKFVLTTNQIISKIARGRGELASPTSFLPSLHIPGLQWITTDRECSEQDETLWRMPQVEGSTIALLQYTSGSTATPKGVMVSHSNLLSNHRMIQSTMGHPVGVPFVSWLPLFHDMGLISKMLQALYMGSPCILLSPSVFMQSPFRWLEAISLHQAYYSGAPNFAYDLCVEKITPEQRDTLDLSSWKVAFCGAEPVRSQTLTRFAAYFAPCGFRVEALKPVYGLAEATVFVTGHPGGKPPVAHRLKKEALEQHQVLLCEEATGDTADEKSIAVCTSCGKSELDGRVVIVDPETCVLSPAGKVGEIWLAGSHVAKGYWNRNAGTEATFHAYLKDTGEGPFLRTGDLGFLLDGNLFVTGRLKDVIIIQGRNHYPQDIEQTVQQCHSALRSQFGAAFSISAEDELLEQAQELLVIVQEVPRACRSREELDQVCRAIRHAVTEQHDIAVHSVTLIRYGCIPKTSSGKIQRRVCRSSFLDGSLNVLYQWMRAANRRTLQHGETGPSQQTGQVAPSTLLQEVLRQIWQEVLDLQEIGIHDHFFELGGHSLRATQVMARIHQTLQVDLPLRRLFEAPTIAQLAHHLEQVMRQEASGHVSVRPAQSRGKAPYREQPYLPLQPMERPNNLPVSFAQERLWFLHQWDPDGTWYNESLTFRLCGLLHIEALERSVATVVQRHEILRTTFSAKQGRPVQVITPAVQDTSSDRRDGIAAIDLRGYPTTERDRHMRQLVRTDALRPFDLMRGPLWRLRLLRLDEQEHILLLTLHHIICDGWSMGIFLREITSIYRAHINGEPSGQAQGTVPTLPELPIQYTDYVLWQREWLQGETLKEQLAYWRKQLAGIPALLELPTDRPRPAVQRYAGARQSRLLPPELLGQLKDLSRREGVTLFMTGLAAFLVLLMRYSGETDVVVGTPIAGRIRAELEGLIGFFVNMLVLRVDLSGNPSFGALLARVREVALQAYMHQDLPFEKLVEELQPERDQSHQPLFQVLFSLEMHGVSSDQEPDTQAFPRLELPEVSWSLMEVESQTAKFDLSLILKEGPAGLLTMVEYSTDLFDATTITRLLGHWQVLLETIACNPGQTIETLPLLTDAEREQIVGQRNANASLTSTNLCLHQLFEQQVEQTPDAIAVVFEQTGLTYGELNARANQIAGHLSRAGIGPEKFVGVCMDRSLELVTALLGVLKAGGAYVPLDPSYPQERQTFMLEDAQVSIVLTQTHLMPRLAVSSTLFICLDDWVSSDIQSDTNLESQVLPENLAYMIYTSGSTGQPKGVMVTHANVVRLFAQTNDCFHFQAEDVWTLFHSSTFDFSVWEIWGALLHGGSLVVVPYWVSRSPDQFAHLLIRQQVTVLNQTPSAFRLLMDEEQTHQTMQGLALRLIIFGGEALNVGSLQPWMSRHGEEPPQLINMYGITETTVHVTYRPLSQADVTAEKGSVIGRAIPDLQLYILDTHQQLVPIGVPGELYVGGMGLARGYLRRPELTAEHFLPHSFVGTGAAQGTIPTVPVQLGARLYRTGDLVRLRSDGDIEYLGRADHQVKIRGFRIELGEIEATLMRHPVIREAVVLSREDVPGEKRLAPVAPQLVAYVVGEGAKALSVSELRGYLQEKLPDYMIPAFFVLLDALPLTAHGKVDCDALPAPQEGWERVYVGEDQARTPIEELLVGLWSEVLGCGQVGIDANFFELGGHSLLATQLVARLRAVLNIVVPLRVVFEAPTIAVLAKHVEFLLRRNEGIEIPALVKGTRTSALPLSFAQLRLWFLDQLAQGSTAYLMPAAYHVIGEMKVQCLDQCLQELIRRHEILRTTFVLQADQPVQIIHPVGATPVPTCRVIDLQGLLEEQRTREAQKVADREFQQPMSLARGPLLRTHVLRMTGQEHVLLLMLHHIVTDGWSNAVLLRELTTLYDAFFAEQPSPLQPLPLQYADYALWQRAWLQGKVLDVLLDYWTKQLAGARPLELPTDRPRAAVGAGIVPPRNRGAAYRFTWPSHLWSGLTTLSQEVGVTLFMTLLAAFQIVLSRSTGERDIVVGTDVASRTSLELEGMVGFFVNLLVLRVQLSQQETFRETLRKVATTVLTAYAHQDLPFEKLVDALQLERNPDQVPLVNVLFVLQNVPEPAPQFSGLEVCPLDIEIQNAKFDVALFLTERGQEISGSVNYREDLFDAHTIATLVQHFAVLLQSIVTSPDIPIELLDMRSREEKEQRLKKEVMRQEADRRKLTVAKRRLITLTEHDFEGIGG